MMPRFSGTATDHEGNIRVRTVDCKVRFRDNSIAWLSPNDLLSRAPGGHYDIMNHMFGPRDSQSSPKGTGNERPKLRYRILPALIISQNISTQNQLDGQTKRWLEQRLIELYPSRHAVAVTFDWHHDLYRMNDTNRTLSKVGREPLGVFEVRLDESR